jgi:hypothetical protein
MFSKKMLPLPHRHRHRGSGSTTMDISERNRISYSRLRFFLDLLCLIFVAHFMREIERDVFFYFSFLRLVTPVPVAHFMRKIE